MTKRKSVRAMAETIAAARRQEYREADRQTIAILEAALALDTSDRANRDSTIRDENEYN